MSTFGLNSERNIFDMYISVVFFVVVFSNWERGVCDKYTPISTNAVME